MATMFKDFHKEVKDLLNKFYTKGEEWKIESKVKAVKDQLIVNPAATNKGVTCELEYKAGLQPIAIKTTLCASGISKLSASFEQAPNKVELSSTNFDGSNLEASYELKKPQFTVNNKVNAAAADAYVSAEVYKSVFVGSGATYNFKNKSVAVFAGARWAPHGGYILDTFVSNFKAFTTGVVVPVYYEKKFMATLAAQVECGHDLFKMQAGLETPCMLFPTNKIKMRVDNEKNASLAYVAVFPTWKAAVTIYPDAKIGAHFILE